MGARALDVLNVRQHWRAASTSGNTNTGSIEGPHDDVHVRCGFPMQDLSFAAFYPGFWLHHANIDR
jgi:hypothetical protein